MDKKLTFRNYFSFGLGDYAFNLFFQGTTLFLFLFYTDVLGIEVSTAGTIFLIATVWDAITDPLMGHWAGKTRSRWGRYRPYLLLASIPLGLSYMMMFYNIALTGTTLVIWALVWQMLFRTFFTLGNIPYSSLSSEMTYDSNERSKLAAYRMFLGYGGAMTVSYLTSTLMQTMGWLPEENAYFYIGILFAVIASVLFYVCFQNTYELPPKENQQSVSLQGTWKMLQSNRPFGQICLFILVGMAGVVIFYQSLNYYFIYNLGEPTWLGIGMLILFACLMLSLPIWLKMSEQIGKLNTLMLGCLVLILGSLSFYFNHWIAEYFFLVFIHMGIIGVGIGCAAFSFWAMLPDTVEYGEWKTGIRAEAILFGLGLFCLKLGLGLGSFILGHLLAFFGYIANGEQSVEAFDGIHAITSLGIGVSGLFILLIMWSYPLTKELHQQILEEVS